MLTWMTSYPALIGKLEKYITPEDFTTPLYRQIAEMIVLQYHEGGVNPAKLLNQFVDSEEQKEVAGLLMPESRWRQRRKNGARCMM